MKNYIKINEINNILDLCREYEVDILGLGEAIYKKYPEEFTPNITKWRKMIKEIPIEISVTANIRRSGMLD
ncbi:MAG: Ger(x)C family spore germination C-terminal domain-containing protein [Halanaerobiales bacterium]